jgi:hypothetical protein
MQTKNDFIHWAGYLGKNDSLEGKETALACHPTRKVNKVKDLIYLSTS